MSASVDFEAATQQITASIKKQMESRAVRGSVELRNAAMLVLRGQGGGRRYRVPGTSRFYTASAPGQPPAVRTGAFRNSWQAKSVAMFGSYISRVESTHRTDNGRYVLGSLLEDGTSRMAPRPHQDKIAKKAEPKIVKIYSAPYF